MTILLVLCLCSITNCYGASARLSIYGTEDPGEKYLKLINKPLIRSIQTKFGSVIDCVDINSQPAFDHPLLKNHKLQRKPTFQNKGATTDKEHVLPIRTVEFELEKDSCPIGSIPIRRTTRDDLIRMKSSSNETYLLTQEVPDSHFAVLHTKKGANDSYFGVHGNVNVQNPRVEKTQMSLAQIAVQNGEQDQLNTILFGWQVFPQLYGQESTNLFALWTMDSFKTTGCYNMLCPGFVQINDRIFLGIRMVPVSSYGGDQYDLSLSISQIMMCAILVIQLQDPKTKNWWLIAEDINIGYYPIELFTHMSVANFVGWGGRVSGVVNGTSAQMGSGHFPDGDMKHACFVRRLSYNVSTSVVKEPNKGNLYKYVDSPRCYRLRYFGFVNDDHRHTFQFGGPGGDCRTTR
ncbi:hypothetical protein CR513_06999, partial [Mucuna pruriens]